MTNSAVEMMPDKEETEQFDFLQLPDPSITLPLPLPTQSFLKAAISLKERVTFFTLSLSSWKCAKWGCFEFWIWWVCLGCGRVVELQTRPEWREQRRDRIYGFAGHGFCVFEVLWGHWKRTGPAIVRRDRRHVCRRCCKLQKVNAAHCTTISDEAGAFEIFVHRMSTEFAKSLFFSTRRLQF